MHVYMAVDYVYGCACVDMCVHAVWACAYMGCMGMSGLNQWYVYGCEWVHTWVWTCVHVYVGSMQDCINGSLSELCLLLPSCFWNFL